MSPTKPSQRLDGCYPAPGTSKIGDEIRVRRGARGITALDAALLYNPDIANGWNTLLGAVRTKNTLTDIGREIIILRVAAINGAAYEWIHHEHIGRDAGLTVSQLKRIRDLDTPLDDQCGAEFTPLQQGLLVLADSMTRDCKIADTAWADLKQALEGDAHRKEKGVSVDQQLSEACVTAATYNMVSRFLRAADVGGSKDDPVPVPE